jgi:acyl-CoA dehydrogenase
VAFYQTPPSLGNQYDDDPLLREHLARTLPEPVLRAIEPELRHLGELAGGKLHRMQIEDLGREPILTQWDAWGHRVDRIEVTPLWREAARLAVEHGLVAAAYEKTHGEHARVHMFALNYLVDASLDVYSCPLAMTDGAARTLLAHGNRPLIDRAVPRLTSRDPAFAWTSGQWMTERTGGSDVGLTETVARPPAPCAAEWRLHGTKWFTSAITSDMALTLARPEGNGPGGRGLALFYLEIRDAAGTLNHLQVNRLKDKLGTRKVPTAELTLDGTLALPVAGLDSGIRNITPMLNITRTWNAVGAAAGMRRAVALARDFARRRHAFGALLAEKPLHSDTLAGIAAEAEAGFHLTFRAVELLGRLEAGIADEHDQLLVRVLTPIVKLTTGKQAVAVASEAVESFGGAGYVEDTGLPRLLRDAQVLPIWEGTTNVLSLDLLRGLAAEGAFAALTGEIGRHLAAATAPSLAGCVQAARAALSHAQEWLSANLRSPAALEAGARRFALTLGRTLELALLARHAHWCGAEGRGPRAEAAARRFAAHGVDLIADAAAEDAQILARR